MIFKRSGGLRTMVMVGLLAVCFTAILGTASPGHAAADDNKDPYSHAATWNWQAQPGGCANAVLVATWKIPTYTGSKIYKTYTEQFTCNSIDGNTMTAYGTDKIGFCVGLPSTPDHIVIDNYATAKEGTYYWATCTGNITGNTVKFHNAYGDFGPIDHAVWVPKPGTQCMNDSSQTVDAILRHIDAHGNTVEDFTCFSGGPTDPAMTLYGTVQPGNCVDETGSSKHPDEIKLSDFRNDITAPFVGASQDNPGGSCPDGPQVSIPITNTYADATHVPTDLFGHAAWTGTSPGQLTVNFDTALGDQPATCHFSAGADTTSCTSGVVFDQTSISGNSMTLNGPKAASSCPNETVAVGDDSRQISYTDALYAQVTVYDSPHAGPGPNNVVCVAHSGSVSIASVFATVGGAPTGTTGSTDVQCPLHNDSGLGWILCPIFFLGKDMAQALQAQIQNLLYVNTGQIFNASFQKGYNSIRDIALSLLVIAALVMVVSQASGLEIFSAYATRKALPRIVAGALFMAVAWPVLQFVVTFFNDLGIWISNLILAAVQPGGASGTAYNDAGSRALSGLVGGTVLAAGGTITIFIFGAIGGLSFLGTFIISLLIGYLVLTIRQIIIIVAILLAPLAIAASILPGTERLWKFWRETLITTLMMFPIMMAFLSSGAALSIITGNAASSAQAGGPGGSASQWLEILSIVAFYVPFFAFTRLLQMTGGLMGNISGMVSNQGRGMLQGLQQYRGRQRGERTQRFLSGQLGRGNLPWDNRLNRFGNAVGAFGSSEDKVGYLLPGARGATTRQAAQSRHQDMAAQDYAKLAGTQATQFNDDMLWAQTYTTEAEARASLLTRWNNDAARVNRAIASANTQGGFGRARQNYATTQLAATGTGYEDMTDMLTTVARVAGQNPSAIGSMIGNIRSAADRGGRTADLKGEYGQMVGITEDLAQNPANILTAPMTERLNNATVSAAMGADNATIMRGKGVAVRNAARALANGQMLATARHNDDDAAAIRAKIENLEASAKLGYGAEGNARALSDELYAAGSVLANPAGPAAGAAAGGVNAFTPGTPPIQQPAPTKNVNEALAPYQNEPSRVYHELKQRGYYDTPGGGQMPAPPTPPTPPVSPPTPPSPPTASTP